MTLKTQNTMQTTCCHTQFSAPTLITKTLLRQCNSTVELQQHLRYWLQRATPPPPAFVLPFCTCVCTAANMIWEFLPWKDSHLQCQDSKTHSFAFNQQDNPPKAYMYPVLPQGLITLHMGQIMLLPLRTYLDLRIWNSCLTSQFFPSCNTRKLVLLENLHRDTCLRQKDECPLSPGPFGKHSEGK